MRGLTPPTARVSSRPPRHDSAARHVRRQRRRGGGRCRGGGGDAQGGEGRPRRAGIGRRADGTGGGGLHRSHCRGRGGRRGRGAGIGGGGDRASGATADAAEGGDKTRRRVVHRQQPPVAARSPCKTLRQRSRRQPRGRSGIAGRVLPRPPHRAAHRGRPRSSCGRAARMGVGEGSSAQDASRLRRGGGGRGHAAGGRRHSRGRTRPVGDGGGAGGKWERRGPRPPRGGRAGAPALAPMPRTVVFVLRWGRCPYGACAAAHDGPSGIGTHMVATVAHGMRLCC